MIFLICHNALFTNDKLVKCKLTDDPLCSLCFSETENIFHLLIVMVLVTYFVHWLFSRPLAAL